MNKTKNSMLYCVLYSLLSGSPPHLTPIFATVSPNKTNNKQNKVFPFRCDFVVSRKLKQNDYSHVTCNTSTTNACIGEHRHTYAHTHA